MTKILTKSQFESQAFKCWAKTGLVVNNYKHYMEFVKRELKRGLEVKKIKFTRYVWRTTGDERVRSKHMRRNGRMRDWRIGEKPGEDFGCRCLAIFVDAHGYPTGIVGRARYNKESEEYDYETEDLISSHYDKVRSNGKKHKGIDFRMPEGSIVRAVKAGTVNLSGWQDSKDHSKGYGFRVQILNKDGTYSDYGHMLENFFVYKDDIVTAGQEIGYVGSTGKSSGNHLHYSERNSDYEYEEPESSSVKYILDDFARQKFDE